MTPAPDVVALPSVPVIAWFTNRSADGKHRWEHGDAATNPAYVQQYSRYVWEPLVRQSDHLAALRAAEQRAEAAEADAARYQWLTGEDSEWDAFDSGWLSRNDLYGTGPTELNEFIDAALKQGEQPS